MRLWTSILAGLQVVSGGTILLEIWDRKWVGLFVLLVAAAQVATVAYMRTPHQAKHAESKTGGPE